MKKSKGDLTRARVIEGAMRAVSAIGVVGLTTRKIATESEVHLATLHYYFDSKSSLLLAVLQQLIDEMMVAFREEVKSSSNVDECIKQVLRASWRWVKKTRLQQIVQYELTLYALRDGAQWLAEQQYDAYVDIYSSFLIDVSRRTNELSTTDCGTVARLMLAGVDGLILQELAKPNEARSKRGIDALIGAAQVYARTLIVKCKSE